jgi:hypothetical protein
MHPAGVPSPEPQREKQKPLMLSLGAPTAESRSPFVLLPESSKVAAPRNSIGEKQLSLRRATGANQSQLGLVDATQAMLGAMSEKAAAAAATKAQEKRNIKAAAKVKEQAANASDIQNDKNSKTRKNAKTGKARKSHKKKKQEEKVDTTTAMQHEKDKVDTRNVMQDEKDKGEASPSKQGQRMCASASRSRPSGDEANINTKRRKEKSTDGATMQKKSKKPGYSVEASRCQVMCRSGEAGRGQCVRFGFEQFDDGREGAVRAGKEWVTALCKRKGLTIPAYS